MTDISDAAWRDAVMLRVTGANAREFLQGYLSSNTDRLVAGAAVPMAICNLKGRVVASGWALDLAPDVGLLVHASLGGAVREFLKPYVAFSRCELAADEAVAVVAADGHDLGAGLLVAPRDEVSAALPDCSETVLERLTEARFVFASAPVSGEFLPQMLGLHDAGAVDFDKGCYLGQEIVARAQFRGAVKRQLQARSYTGEAPAPGDTLDGGTVVQAAGGTALVVA